MGQRFRHFLSSRTAWLLGGLVLIIGLAIAARDLGLAPRPLPDAGILALDLRHGLPDKAGTAPDGRRSVSTVTVLRALDAARHDARIAGVYLRVGGSGMSLAQALEIADAVKRVRRGGKFAVAWSEGFSAANLSDRVLASAADEIWTGAADTAGVNSVKRHTSMPENQAYLWKQLLRQATREIGAAEEPPQSRTGTTPLNAMRRAKGLSPPQWRQGPEFSAEQAALQWGGADSRFVNLLTYRDALDRRGDSAPVIAVIQAEGVLDILEGPGPHELAGDLAQRVREAAGNPRVRAIVIRISAVAAPDEAMRLVVGAGEEARRRGISAGISFGPVIPASAAALSAELPLSAPEGALLVNAGPRAARLAERTRLAWRAGGPGGRRSIDAAGETLFLEEGTAVATVTAVGTEEMTQSDVPRNTGTAPVLWQNDVGTLLDMKDRLVAAQGGGPGREILLMPFEPRPSVWSRTKARFAGLWSWLTGLLPERTAETAAPATGEAG